MRGAAQLLSRLLVRHAASLQGGPCAGAARPSAAATGQLGARQFSSQAEGGSEAPQQQAAPQPTSPPQQQQQQQAQPGKPKPQAASKQPKQQTPKQQQRPQGKQQQPQGKQPPPRQQQQPQGKQLPPAKQQPQGKAEPPKEEAPERPWHSSADVAQLATIPPLKYFDVSQNVCPEATKQYYADPALADERVNQPNYGCKAVQAELAALNTGALLQREVIQRLVGLVAERQRGHVLLEGWTGSGKSVALYSLVNWARSNGWIVLYIPSAYMLVEGGTFYKGEDGLWDTPDAARFILNSVLDNHGSALKKLHGSNGQPLSKLVSEGLGAKAPADVVAAAIQLKQELQGQKDVPVLLAVDDYNVLYSHTGYQEAVHAFHHRDLSPDELRLVRAFRLLEQPAPANGVVVAAPTFGQTVSDKLRLPAPAGARLGVPRYSLEELAATVHYYMDTGYISGTPSVDMLKRALFLTNGNARELREYAATLLHADDPLGLSLGYKAKAHRLKHYLETV